MALVTASVAAGTVNGQWTVDVKSSDDFESAGEEFNRKRNELERRDKKQTFDRDGSGNRSRNRFDGQRLATERMIAEDYRSQTWSVSERLRPLLNAETIKLYRARKLVVLYDGNRKRLLTINPAGRAYSASGTQLTRDGYGRSLTWIDGEAVVIETDLVSGDRLVERYEPGEDGETLTASIRFQQAARGPWLEYTRVFSRSP